LSYSIVLPLTGYRYTLLIVVLCRYLLAPL